MDEDFYEDQPPRKCFEVEEPIVWDNQESKKHLSISFSSVGDEGKSWEVDEKNHSQDPEIYFKYNDLMKYVNLEVTEDSDDLTPFELMKTKMTKLTEDGKVMKLVRKAGVGNKCPPNAVVKFHYRGYLEYNEVPFDISCLRQMRPESRRLGTGSLLPGLEIGIPTMFLNEKADFLLHHDYAFGELGCGDRVPPKSTVLFCVELLGIEHYQVPENDEIENYTEEESYKTLISRAKAHIQRGTMKKNVEKNNIGAIKEYRFAKNILTKIALHSDSEEMEQRGLLLKTHSNLMICHIANLDFRKACSEFNEALYDGGHEARSNSKLLFNHAKALSGLNEFGKAHQEFMKVKKLCPNNAEVEKELKILREKQQKRKEDERLMFGKMFAT